MTPATSLLTNVEAYRGSTALYWASVWTRPWQDIEEMELVPGFPLKSDLWIIPSHWASGGQFKRPGKRTIDFCAALPRGWAREELRSELVIRRLKRLACLLFVRATRAGKYYREPSKPSTWVSNCRYVARAARSALELGDAPSSPFPSACPDGPAIFAHLDPSRMQAVKARNKNFAHAVVARINGLFAEGAFDDWPANDVGPIYYDNSTKIPPFNDEFTSALCAAALWMTEIIGSDLLRCWRELKEMELIPGRTAIINKLRKEFIAGWSGATLIPGFEFPYSFQLVTVGEQGASKRDVVSWPPRNRVGVRNMLHRLQEAHGILISLAIGPRDGEATDLPRDCLRRVHDGDVLVGQTFKLSDSPHGEMREWPLPKAVVLAIQQQQELAELLDPGGKFLFVPFSTRKSTEEGKRSSLALGTFAHKVKHHDGTPLAALCEGNVHSHRFRKTVVRLAALSLVGANQILFDILGHRDPEMTLNYILSDPQIQDEIREIAREACVALAADALRSSDKNGGGAAKDVDEFARRLLPRSGPKELEISSLNQAAEILSMGGRIMLVKRGVLCTKTFNQAGPCTRRAGEPDIGNCSTGCLHRLELEAAKVDHRHAIEQILEEIPEAGDEHNFMRGWWQGQLLAHLMPFADLRAEMLAIPRVRAALDGASFAEVERLLDATWAHEVKRILEAAA